MLQIIKRREFIGLLGTGLAAMTLPTCKSPKEKNVKSDGAFSIHPNNPRCFLYQSKPFKILTSAEHYGAVLNADFDYDVYLKEMQRTGQNQTRVFTFYRERWGFEVSNTLAPTTQAYVSPWERVPGQGTGADGLDKFDLNRWNSSYFTRLKDYVRKCASQGVICEIVLFCSSYNKFQYDWFPCSKINNVNDVGTDLDEWNEFQTLDCPTIVRFQEQFVRKMVEELNKFDNVYYEICNEPYAYGPEEWQKKMRAWQAHIISVIRQVEKDLPKRHLIAANVHLTDFDTVKNPDVDIINYHYLSGGRAGNTWHFFRQRDGFDKPIVFDENSGGLVGGWRPVWRYSTPRYEASLAEVWETILSGGAGFSNLDWTFTHADETGSGKVLIRDYRNIDGRNRRQWFDLFRKLINQYDLASLVPTIGVLPEKVPGYGYAVSTDGEGRYILYFVDEKVYQRKPSPRQVLEVSLDLPPGRYSVRTFGPKTGTIVVLSQLQSNGISKLKIPEFTEDVAVLLDLLK